MSQSGYVHLEDCRVVRVTDQAVLIWYGDIQLWVPKSQMADADGFEPGDGPVTVSVTEWIAAQKGIEVE